MPSDLIFRKSSMCFPARNVFRISLQLLYLNGPVNKPDVNIDLEDTRKYIVEEVKKSSKEELQKTINKLGDGLKNILVNR
jgi:predicted nuclease of restriction endonuclease-like RecB superfamily